MSVFDVSKKNDIAAKSAATSDDNAETCVNAKTSGSSPDAYVHSIEEMDYKVLDSVARSCFQSYAVARNLELSERLDLAMPFYAASDVKDELNLIWYSISAAKGMIVDPRTRELVPISKYEDLSLYYKTLFELFGEPGPSNVGEGDSREQLEAAKKSFSDALEVVLSASKVLDDSGSSVEKRTRDHYCSLLQKMQSIEEVLQAA